MLRITVLKNGCGLGNCYVVENKSPSYFGWTLTFTIFYFDQNLYGCQKEQTFLWKNPKLLQTDSRFLNDGNNSLRFDLFEALFLVYFQVVVIMWNFFSLGCRLWHCLFGNYQTRLMLPEESGKNLFKAKIKGWALLVVSFF